jgi:hypothetical protein
MKKNCNAIMERFMELDKNEKLPFYMTLHLLFCRDCRTSVRMLTLAERQAAQPLAEYVTVDDAFMQAIMAKVSPLTQESAAPVTMRRWVVSGLIMIAALFCFPIFSDMRLPDTEILTLSFYLLFGCAVAVYCVIFVGGNLDFFIKQIELAKKAHQAS